MKALVRLSPEITTKAPQTRKRFVRQLVLNLGRAFAAHGLLVRVTRDHARVYLDGVDATGLTVARRVFGVLSISPCREETLPEGLEALVAQAREVMAPRVAGRTFACRARVRDRMAGYGSQQVNEALGDALVAAGGRVDLDAPEVHVHLETRHGRVRYFTDRVEGESGTPLGVSGRAVALLSAGFDSAVAAWLMMRRGIEVDFLTCRLGGDAHERAVLSVADRLAHRWAPGWPARLTVVPFEEVVERIRRDIEERYRQLALKRAMYRVAQAHARAVRADAVVTGESIGQVSSQTLPNLRALTVDPGVPVLRPLLTSSKNEILARAEHIGTFHLSSGVPEYCALGQKPATAARRGVLAAQEARLSLDEVALLASAHRIELPSTGADGVRDVSTLREVPEGAVVLDLRAPPARAEALPHPGTRWVDPLEVLAQPAVLDTDATYVVVCDSGGRADWFARELRDLGFRAYRLVDQ